MLNTTCTWLCNFFFVRLLSHFTKIKTKQKPTPPPLTKTLFLFRAKNDRWTIFLKSDSASQELQSIQLMGFMHDHLTTKGIIFLGLFFWVLQPHSKAVSSAFLGCPRWCWEVAAPMLETLAQKQHVWARKVRTSSLSFFHFYYYFFEMFIEVKQRSVRLHVLVTQ